MTAVPLGETPSLCILCAPAHARVARPGGVTDWVCHDKLRGQLDEIVTRFARLSASPSGSGLTGGRRSPGYHSKPPGSIHVMALRDPRTAPTELGEPHAPLNLLISWSTWMRKVRRETAVAWPGGTDDLLIAQAEADYLLRSMDWITRQSWVKTFADQTRAVLAQLRSATGEPNPRPVGTCPQPLTDGETCSHPLFPPRPGELNIRCGGCGTTYEPLEQIRLARAHGQAERAGCARCPHTSAQHSNDTEARACNARWCTCTGYQEEEGP